VGMHSGGAVGLFGLCMGRSLGFELRSSAERGIEGPHSTVGVAAAVAVAVAVAVGRS
jgi:hypothetical protein